MALARAIVSGSLAADPEKRFTPNNAAVTNFILTVPPPPGFGTRQAESFAVKVTCWRGLADAAAQSLKKGYTVLVDGRLMINAFQGSDGVQKRQYEIDATSLSQVEGSLQPILPLQAEGNAAPYRQAQAQPTPAAIPEPTAYGTAEFSQAPMQPAPVEDFLTEDDIPF